MDSFFTAAPINSLRIPSSPFHPTLKPKTLRFPSISRVSASSSSTPNPILRSIRTTAAGAVILTAALLAGPFPPPSSKADPPPSSTTTELDEVENLTETEKEAESKAQQWKTHWKLHASFLRDSEGDAVANLLYSKRNDAGPKSIFRCMIAAQPSENRLKFLDAIVHTEMGEARRLFEEILADDSVDLFFESRFENAILMVCSGEGELVIRCLKQAAELAHAARDVRLITAQIQFLKKNVEEALASYEQLASEDPNDFRPYYCQGVIYSLLGRNKEARDKFTKYYKLK